MSLIELKYFCFFDLCGFPLILGETHRTPFSFVLWWKPDKSFEEAIVTSQLLLLLTAKSCTVAIGVNYKEKKMEKERLYADSTKRESADPLKYHTEDLDQVGKSRLFIY